MSTQGWIILGTGLLAMAFIPFGFWFRHNDEDAAALGLCIIFVACCAFAIAGIHAWTNDVTTKVAKQHRAQAVLDRLDKLNKKRADAEDKRRDDNREELRRLVEARMEAQWHIDVFSISVPDNHEGKQVVATGHVRYLTPTQSCEADWDRPARPALFAVKCEDLPPRVQGG